MRSRIESNTLTFIFFALMFGFLIGMIICGFLMSTFNTAIIKTDFIDNVCNQNFGEGYVYEDNIWFGEDFEITCYNQTAYLEELNNSKQEEVWISKK